jgi:hypothetical protein
MHLLAIKFVFALPETATLFYIAVAPMMIYAAAVLLSH